MKTILPILALICLQINLAKSQVIFNEDFESDFEPNSWITSPVWKIGTASTLSSSDFNFPAHSQFAGVNDDGPGAGIPSFGLLITKEIDLTGVQSALLKFDAYFIDGDYDADETFRVLISTDAMQSWGTLYEVQGSSTWQSVLLNLGDAFADLKIHLAFEYDDNDGWNYGCGIDNVKLEVTPDFFCLISFPTILDYTISTPRQLDGQPLYFVHKIENYGIQAVNDLKLEMVAALPGQGTVAVDSHFINIPIGASVLDTFQFFPSEKGAYHLEFNASHAILGADFYQKSLPNAFELSDSTLAKDDSERDVSIGMSFGNPAWYGYYGSEFDLSANDTLTGISVWMTTQTAGSFNLTVNKKDASGKPNTVIYQSGPTEIQAGFTNWVYHPLSNELPLAAGNYVFCVGQDTIQGIMGHGMDSDRTNPGYWITSPVAGGGYPWFNWPEGQTLMIRPHLKLQPVLNLVKEPAYSTLKVYPNPAGNYVQFDFENNTGEPLQITLADAAGRVVVSEKTAYKELNISQLQPGLYFMKIQNGERIGMAKLMKQ